MGLASDRTRPKSWTCSFFLLGQTKGPVTIELIKPQNTSADEILLKTKIIDCRRTKETTTRSSTKSPFHWNWPKWSIAYLLKFICNAYFARAKLAGRFLSLCGRVTWWSFNLFYLMFLLPNTKSLSCYLMMTTLMSFFSIRGEFGLVMNLNFDAICSPFHLEVRLGGCNLWSV